VVPIDLRISLLEEERDFFLKGQGCLLKFLEGGDVELHVLDQLEMLVQRMLVVDNYLKLPVQNLQIVSPHHFSNTFLVMVLGVFCSE